MSDTQTEFPLVSLCLADAKNYLGKKMMHKYKNYEILRAMQTIALKADEQDALMYAWDDVKELLEKG